MKEVDKRSWQERLGINKSTITNLKPHLTDEKSDEQKSPVHTVTPDTLADKLRSQREAAERLATERVQAAKERAASLNAPRPAPMPPRPALQPSAYGSIAASRPVAYVPIPAPATAAYRPPIYGGQKTAAAIKNDTPLEMVNIKNPIPNIQNSVFVIHGRNQSTTDSLNHFLRSINLKPIEFSAAIQQTIAKLSKGGNPHISEILDTVFESTGALVVLFTGDDEVRLKKALHHKREKILERTLNFQARPNVLFEAGMAYAKHPEKTVFVTVGKVKEFSDIAGRHMMYLDNSTKSRRQLALRLKSLGCPVDLDGDDWENAGRFPK